MTTVKIAKKKYLETDKKTDKPLINTKFWGEKLIFAFSVFFISSISL